MTVRDAVLSELDPVVLYRIMRLRSEVFVVEQACVYLDQDGRDLEPTARQLWIERDAEVIATLRLLTDDGGVRRIGRVATAASARGTGLAAELMRHALTLCEGAEIVLDAQSYLLDWYRGFGFEPSGPEYLEDGIAHVPMRRPAG